MRSANFEILKEKIVRPDIDRHIFPLMLYRGNTGFSKMTRLWNFVILCMESEAASDSEAIALSHNPDFAHLCGPTSRVGRTTLPGLFGRLLYNPKVTDNIPGLTAYVKEFRGWKFEPTPVPLYTGNGRARGAPWRIRGLSPEQEAAKAAARKGRKRGPKPRVHDLVLPAGDGVEFPFMLHAPQQSWAASLLKDVHAIIPKSFPGWLRADVCQDLVTDILAGRITAAEFDGSVQAIVEKLFGAHALKYRGIMP